MKGLKHKYNNKLRDIKNLTIKGRERLSSRKKDLVWFHLRKEIFPKQRKSKLKPRGDGLFQVLRKANNNAYQFDLPKDFGVHTTFNDLIPFVGDSNDYIDLPNLRTNPSPEGGDDDIGPAKGSITRSMTRKIQEDWEDTKANGSNGLKLMMTWAKEDVKI